MNTRNISDSEANQLQAGDNHYRSYVGPPDQYDLMGAMQFRLLTSLGLRERHKVLDFGCGSLRVGRLLIPYLQSNCYFGVEPNQWLVEDAIDRQLGRDILKIKSPSTSSNNDFAVPFSGVSFDFILAQSVFSHTGLDVAENILKEFSRVLAPRGIIAVTFSLSHDGSDFSGSGWVYPKCVRYRTDTVTDLANRVGLIAIEIPFFHPRQRWFLMSHSREMLPPGQHLELLSGAVFNVDEFAQSVVGDCVQNNGCD